MVSEANPCKAVRLLDFEEVLTGEAVIDAVRAAAGRAYIEELFFMDDEILYLVGLGDSAPSGNVVVSMMPQPNADSFGGFNADVGEDDATGIFGLLMGQLLGHAGPQASHSRLIAPSRTSSVVVIEHGYTGAKRRDPPKAPNLDDIQCYLAVKDFADKLRAELVKRIADPSILLNRPPVHSDARQLKRTP